MDVVAIDPGTERSAFVGLYDKNVGQFDIVPNEVLLDLLHNGGWQFRYQWLAIEKFESFGQRVGVETFLACEWGGRFIEAWDGAFDRVSRRDVKLHLCGRANAKDADVRMALLDRWGGKEQAVGRKKAPGPLYGISRDCWSALALAVTWQDKYCTQACKSVHSR